MFGFADTQRQMQDILLETRTYAGLQKKALLAETRDKLSFILSRLAIAVVCLLLGGMLLLFFSFFLAYIIGQALGSTALGFACVTAFFFVLFLVFWNFRTRLVIQPVARLMNQVFATPDGGTLESEKVAEELHESRTRLSGQFSQLVHANEEPANRVESMSNWVSRGFAVYEGMRIGLSVVRAFGSIFRRKRRRR